MIIENLNQESFEEINDDEDQTSENNIERNKPKESKEYIDKKEEDF